MTLMNAVQVMGGLAIFIFGMKLMSDGLRKVAGERMRSILRMFSANRFVAVATGAVVTGVIQSSGASTVMVVGFVNAGLLTLVQAIGLILGSHIGTTVTAQLVAFDLNWLIMPSIIIGMIFSFVPNRKISNWSETILGLGFLFLGMLTMSNELHALSKYEPFVKTLQMVNCQPVNGMMPILSKREANTKLVVWDGETVVLGGFIQEKLQKYEDKIPVIGHVPVFGKLFTNKGEKSVKTNMLIFVNARLVNPSGIPVRPNDMRGLPDFRH